MCQRVIKQITTTLPTLPLSLAPHPDRSTCNILCSIDRDGPTRENLITHYYSTGYLQICKSLEQVAEWLMEG